MPHLGKGVSEKNFTKVSAFLNRWLGNEPILALFRTSRLKRPIDGLILTEHRLITVNGIAFGDIKVIDEVPADNLVRFTSEKGFGKIIKIYAEKKDGESVYVGMVGSDDYELDSFLPKMSGNLQTINERIKTTKNDDEDARKQAAISKKENERKEQEKIKESSNKTKQERKASDVARIANRGKKLGYVSVNYVGGYDSEHKKTFFEGYLDCYENEIEYKSRNITVPADQIASFEITGKELSSTTSRLTVTRLVTLGVFSLAAPKHKTKTQKEATIYIGLTDGRQLMFHTKNLTESDVHKKLANAISRYSILQTKSANSPEPVTLDVASEIARFADLKKQGILTDDEFEAKKKQLLGL